MLMLLVLVGDNIPDNQDEVPVHTNHQADRPLESAAPERAPQPLRPRRSKIDFRLPLVPWPFLAHLNEETLQHNCKIGLQHLGISANPAASRA